MKSDAGNKMLLMSLFLVALAIGSGLVIYFAIPELLIAAKYFLLAFLPILLISYLAIKQPDILKAILIAVLVIGLIASIAAIELDHVYANLGRNYVFALVVFIIVLIAMWNESQKKNNPRYQSNMMSIMIYLAVVIGIMITTTPVIGLGIGVGIPILVIITKIINELRNM